MRVLACGLAAVLLVTTAPTNVIACSPAPGWPGDVVFDPHAVAREMVRAAASVDLAAVAETNANFEIFTKAEAERLASASTESEKNRWREIYASERADWAGIGRRATYRVVERLKGNGSREFVLNAQRPPVPPGSPESEILSWNVSLKQLPSFFNNVDLADKESGGDCLLPIFATPGGTFLVFRDPAGKLLYHPIWVELRREKITVNGPAYVPISSQADPWLMEVRKAIVAE